MWSRDSCSTLLCLVLYESRDCTPCSRISHIASLMHVIYYTLHAFYLSMCVCVYLSVSLLGESPHPSMSALEVAVEDPTQACLCIMYIYCDLHPLKGPALDTSCVAPISHNKTKRVFGLQYLTYGNKGCGLETHAALCCASCCMSLDTTPLVPVNHVIKF